MLVGPKSTMTNETFRRRSRLIPHYIVQPTLVPNHTRPTFVDEGARRAMSGFRSYCLCGDHRAGVGGRLTALREGSLVVNSSQAGRHATPGPVEPGKGDKIRSAAPPSNLF